jgi:hypothetical protein
MAKNIGTFTAAGVDLDKRRSRSRASPTWRLCRVELAAGLHSDVSAVSGHFRGSVGLQDWNSVVNAGMGGAVFQKSLMRTAENMGTIEKGAVKIDKATGKATVNGESFRNSIMAKPGQESWLTSDVLTKTLRSVHGRSDRCSAGGAGLHR